MLVQMKRQYFTFYFPALLILILFSSCGSTRDVVYFQNSDRISEDMYVQDATGFSTVIMPNDNLFITVSAVNPEAVEVFNANPIVRGGSITTTTLDILGYLVDQKGNINFPLIGEVHVSGLTKSAAVQLLQSKISKYVPDAVINIRFLNYKIHIIGEVNRPGVYTVTDERISVPQAIALAGDLTIYGNRHSVQLIRIENGKKQFYFIDLTTPDIFFSSKYYLLQNDILYIPPNSAKAGSSTYSQNLPLLMSTLSVTLTLISLLIRRR